MPRRQLTVNLTETLTVEPHCNKFKGLGYVMIKIKNIETDMS